MKELEYPFDKAYIQSKRRSIKKTLLSSDTFISKRIAILGGSTTAAIKDMLELFLLNQGIKPEFYESEYNKFYEDAVFSNPELEEFKPEIVYVCTSVRNLITWPSLTDSSESVNAKLQAEIEKYITIWEALQQRFGCMIIQNNFDPPQYRLMGNFDAVSPNGATNYVMRLNLALSEEVGKRPYLNLLDLNYVASDYGLTKWQDEVAWCSFKYAMNLDAVPDLAFNVAKIIKSALGKNKKALVLDLDNTLWGGVIGDDGVDGIELGQELPMGQAYQAFQHYVKKQTELGVVLAIDSKNDEENALAGLNHQDSVLKKEDFACIKANWQPKDV
ncbi:MAG: HAD-IIIC family phosphatase, partial [Pseudobutyrivibrio sp.]|nr:HAD-IIIC family phosphatase [Pseudobutyrivibrio sp.]MCF0184981.1 HAD-IIIC family phosphatase [Bacteroidaceae bacterium]